MDSPQEHVSQNNGIIRETKQKFDSFLKSALENTSQRHQEENRTESRKSASLKYDTSEEDNKEFILNKFFEASDSLHKTNEAKPVPKPRTKLKSNNLKNVTLSPLSSGETFRVTSSKETHTENIKTQSNASSASSTNTYKVSSPKIMNIQEDDLLSQRTFRISKSSVPKIGDIIVHQKDSDSKIVDVQIQNETELSYMKDSAMELHSNSTSSGKTVKSRDNIEKVSNKKIEDELKVLSDTEKTDIEREINNILCITIHRTDKLLLNSFVIHPVVKVHIVDINTGNYYLKKNKERSVIYYYEDNLDYIVPVMCRPYNLQEKRSLIPLWEETILINEEYDYITEQKNNIIIFFEILDFVSMPIGNKSSGWHKIAFSFLKISGKNNQLNLNKKMRLQLYYCSFKKDDSRTCSIWEIWSKNKLVKYPSSLYVSIMNSSVKANISTALRSSGPMEKEIGGNTDISRSNDITKKDDKNTIFFSLKNTVDKNNVLGDCSDKITKLPNVCLTQFETEKEGCFTLRFNNSGSLLACALILNNVYCIVIYSVQSFEQVCYLPGHQDNIYSIRWSSDDSLIIACSADRSVSVWNVNNVSFLQILPHPSYVYANDISNDSIATGCYDTKIRIWHKEASSSEYILKQELAGHNGYITSLLFQKKGDAILSSDSLGVIIEWYQQSDTWILHKKINILGLEGIVINQIELIAKEKRILVHSRDNILRIMDLESSVVMHWLQGGLNTRYQTSCSVSPCGNYIIAGSENSCVNIWKVKSGKYIGSLIPYKNKGITIHAVQFHPKQNMIAVGHFGNQLPVLLFGYNKKNDESNIDLRLIENKKNDSHDKEQRKNKKITKSTRDTFDFKNVLNKLDKLMVGNLN